MAIRFSGAALRKTRAVALAWVLTSVTPTAADQQMLFVVVNGYVGSPVTTYLYEASIVNGHVVSVVRRAVPGWAPEFLSPSPSPAVFITAGGRYVMWQQGYGDTGTSTAIVDRETGQVSFIDLGAWHVAVSDPSRPRMFVSRQNDIVSLAPSGMRTLPNSERLVPRAVSPDGRRLYAVRFEFGIAVREIVVVDSESGGLLRTIPLPMAFTSVPELALSEDESYVWVLTELDVGPDDSEFAIRALDSTTGSQSLVIPLPRSDSALAVLPRHLLVDSVGQRVALSLAYVRRYRQVTEGGEIRVFDALTGVETERTPVGGISTLHLSPGSGTILAFSRDESLFILDRGCGPPVLRALFADSRIPPVVTHGPGGRCTIAAFASAPPAPQLHPAAIRADRTVTVAWTGPSEPTTGFVVEAGSASGLADIATLVVTGNALTVPNVPAGSYYVRVRARNHIGTSAPSDEMLLTVP
jgi:hypothetical protein